MQLAIADLTGGGRLDIIFVTSSYLWVHSTDGSVFFPHGAPNQPSSIETGDVDGDGDLDLVVGSLLPSEPATVWINDGHGTFERVGPALGTVGVRAIELADVDADGDLDAVLGHTSSETQSPLGVWLNEGDGRFESSGQHFEDLIGRDAAIVDLTAADSDGDGAIDILVTLSDGNTAHTLLLRNEEPRPVLAGDFSGDGRVEQGDLDLILLHWGEDGNTLPSGWNGVPPVGAIDQDDLDAVLLNWGSTNGVSTQAPPPPAPLVMERAANSALDLEGPKSRDNSFQKRDSALQSNELNPTFEESFKSFPQGRSRVPFPGRAPGTSRRISEV
jgi:hypothetical protein